MSDGEVAKAVDTELQFRQSELDIIRKYDPQFRKVLPIKKSRAYTRRKKPLSESCWKCCRNAGKVATARHADRADKQLNQELITFATVNSFSLSTVRSISAFVFNLLKENRTAGRVLSG